MMERAKTGIPGLDKLVDGGIPEGSSVLVAGSCGTGKTILCLQFLYNGALEGEGGVYVTFEESKDKTIRQCEEFGWDVKALEDKGLISIYVVQEDDMDEVLENIRLRIGRIKAKRLVLDSLTTMMEHGIIYRSKLSKEISAREKDKTKTMFASRGGEVTRKDIYAMIGEINGLGTTSLLISEAGEGRDYISRDTISEFACDGVLQLRINELGGEIERLLSVRKMRGTGITMTLSPMKFTEDGIVVEE
jgi:circadian clock protein KaiC